MSDHILTPAELERHLAEQLGFLQRSAHLYDEGYLSEIKRMAVTLRILLHTRRYPSLLKQLGQHDRPFFDSAIEFDPENIMSTHGLVSIRIDTGQMWFEPKYDDNLESKFVPFDQWWEGVIFADKQKRIMTRKDLVLIVADQDGGAHVDAQLKAVYAAMSRDNSIGWMIESENGQSEPLLGAERAAVRQIAHEVLRTLVPEYARTAEQARSVKRKSEITNGKMRFAPGEQILFQPTLKSPVFAGVTYPTEVLIDSITTGAVRLVVRGRASDRLTTPGKHEVLIEAGEDGPTGIYGDHTDAVIDQLSLPGFP